MTSPAEIRVTDEMIEAGARVLADDGQMSEYSAQGIVAEVFRAMYGVLLQSKRNNELEANKTGDDRKTE